MKSIQVELYIDVDKIGEQESRLFDSQLVQFEKEFKNLEIKTQVYEFKRYNAKDYIDDEILCENYLSFCANFEESPAPAILMKIILSNNDVEVVKLPKKVLINNINDLKKYLIFQLISVIGKFYN